MAELELSELVELLNEFGERDDDADMPLDESTRNAQLSDLGFDSLGVFNVTVHISERFHVDVPYDDVAQAETLTGLLEVVNKTLAGGPG